MMSSFSIWHWLMFLVMLVIFQVPAWMIVRKAGFPGVLSIVMWVPVLNLLALWVFAMVPWPIARR
ncbi:hypothetical protein K5M36_16890 [Chromobacterium vaccinii]|nr:hypothetical protein [Chromobacterium vaccinii]